MSGFLKACTIACLFMWTTVFSTAVTVAAPNIEAQTNLPEEILVDQPLNMDFTIQHGAKHIDYALVYYRNLLRSSWKTVFIRKANSERWSATIPGEHVSRPGIEIWAVAFDRRGGKHALLSSDSDPTMIPVVERLSRPVTATPIPASEATPSGQQEEPDEFSMNWEEGVDSQEPIEPKTLSEAQEPAEGEELQKAETLEQAEELLGREFQGEPGFKDTDLSEEFALFTAETEAKVKSASKVEQEISTSPSSITVITDEDIRNYGSTSIAEVLRTVPGMDFLEISHADKNLNVRGFNREGSNKMLVLIDGRSVYVDLFGITFWEALPIPVEEIERMEVIRGPASTLYGANAFSGVVNIYTKRPEDIKGLLYGVHAGPYGQTASAVFGDVKDRLGYKLSASYRRLASYDDMDDDSIESVKGSTLIEYAFAKDLGLSISGGAEKDQAKSIFSLVGPVSVSTTQAYTKLNAWWKGLEFQFFWSYLNVAAGFDLPIPQTIAADPNYFVGEEDTSIRIDIDKPDMPLIHSTSHTFDLDLQYNIELGGIDRITVGGNARIVRLDSPDAEQVVESAAEATEAAVSSAPEEGLRTRRYTYSLFLQNELYPVDWFIMNAGIRYELLDVKEHKILDDPTSSEVDNIHSWSPRGSLIFLPHKNHALRISGGVSFRNPAFFESNMQVNLGKLMMTARTSELDSVIPFNDITGEADLAYSGESSLSPEKLYAIEFGYSGRFIKRIELNVDFFYNWYRDLILFDGNPEKLYWNLNPFFALNPDDFEGGETGRAFKTAQKLMNPFRFTNDVDANNVGFELALRVRMTSWLRGFANYSFQHIWVSNADTLKQKYADDYNAFVDLLPTTIDANGIPIAIGNAEAYKEHISPSDIALEDITTVHKENPTHKFNVGLNTHYKGFSANLFGHFVSATERRNFLTRLASSQFYTFSWTGGDGGWIRYNGRDDVAVYTKDPESGDTTVYGIDKISEYFILNFNASYALWDGKMELGVAFFDLLQLPSLWKSQKNNGFTLEKNQWDGKMNYYTANGIASPRYVQYPRQLLFGETVGGETIPTRVFFFIRGKI